MARPLTPKRQLFVTEYLKDLNATQAAIRAGYSPNRADATGWDLLRIPEISSAIKEARDKQAQRNELSADWVLDRLKRESDWMGDDDTSGSPGARVRALELVGKYLGMFEDKLAVRGAGTLTIVERIRVKRNDPGDPGPRPDPGSGVDGGAVGVPPQ